MKIYKILTWNLLFASLVLTAVFYQSCHEKTEQKCGLIKDIFGYYFIKDSTSISKDSSEVQANKLGIAIAFRYNFFECRKNNFSFVNQAYAFVPHITTFQHLDSIKSVQVTSNQEFDAMHPAGSLLNEYFTMPDLDQFNKSASSPFPEENLFLYLNKEPLTNTFHQFTVKIFVQTTNTPFTYTFYHVKLNP